MTPHYQRVPCFLDRIAGEELKETEDKIADGISHHDQDSEPIETPWFSCGHEDADVLRQDGELDKADGKSIDDGGCMVPLSKINISA